MDNLIRMMFRAIKPMSLTGDAGGGEGGGTATAEQGAAAENFSWKGQLAPDFANSPTMQKFSDDKAGFNEAVKSHLSLEQLLGHEKVPIPKGKDDTEGWNRFQKAMGIPDKAEAYGLPDAEVPPDLKGITFDKNKFAEVVHAHKLTPDQAKGLWGAYTEMVKSQYAQMMKDSQTKMTEVVNKMRGEWGDSYETNVELGQMVINKFSSDKDMEDWITSTIMKNPMGIKFLSKIGSQFAENKIGEFGYKRFSLSPEMAREEHDKILQDPNHPYNNEKAPKAERDRAIDYVNNLIAVQNKGRG